MATSTQAHSHCVVQWEDDKNEYAVVHLKRAKTSIMLKVGLTTSFEGNNRDRRRGKILYMGTKKDCTVFSFDFEEQDGHVNAYSWSLAPGLSQQIQETAKSIKDMASGSLQRTISSSSTNSNMVSKNKKQKVNHQTQRANEDPVPPGLTFSTITIGDIDQPSGSNDQQSSNSAHADKTPTTNADLSTSDDIDSLREENKALRAKIVELEGQLILQRQSSIPLPNENCINFLKDVCSAYDQCRREQTPKMIELAKKLPCTDADLKLAIGTKPAITINNLVKCCFNNVDLKQMCYEKLKAKDPLLLKYIHEYVKCVHAPEPIPQRMFSGSVSLKCRHLRENKNNNGSVSKAKKHKKDRAIIIDGKQIEQNHETIQETELGQSEDDKENEEHF